MTAVNEMKVANGNDKSKKKKLNNATVGRKYEPTNIPTTRKTMKSNRIEEAPQHEMQYGAKANIKRLRA
jgi:hypothetical protein